MSGFERFKERLPCKEKFYSYLAGKKIRDKYYECVLKVWDRLEIKTMKDYNFKYDNLLLADVFEKIRNSSLKNYEWFPSCYLSAPDLIWDAIIRMTKFELELVLDVHITLFFEKGMRDEVFYIFKRYSKASNMYLKIKHIIY